MKRHPIFRFQLFVADHALNSAQAVSNLTALCDAHLAGRYEITLIDVFREPKRALAESVFMTPTLEKIAPLPQRRIVGTLSDTAAVLLALGLPKAPPP